jgi:transposase
LAARKSTLDDLQDAENELRGALKTFGLKVGSTTRRTFAARIRELVAGLHILKMIVEALLAVRAVLIEEHNRLHKLLFDQVREDAVSQRLMTVPDVGPVVALSFKTAIDARFAQSRTVGAYLGLTPRRYQSGEIDRTGRISKIGDEVVRTALFEAASVILTRTVRWSKLKVWAVRLAQRSGAKTARSRWPASSL